MIFEKVTNLQNNVAYFFLPTVKLLIRQLRFYKSTFLKPRSVFDWHWKFLFFCNRKNTIYTMNINDNKRQVAGSIQLIYNFLNCIKIKVYNYTVRFTSFSPKIFRLTDLDANCNWKYDITVIWIQILIWKTSLLGILNVSKI